MPSEFDVFTAVKIQVEVFRVVTSTSILYDFHISSVHATYPISSRPSCFDRHSNIRRIFNDVQVHGSVHCYQLCNSRIVCAVDEHQFLCDIACLKICVLHSTAVCGMTLIVYVVK
jgi:hypothetical protein